MFVGLAAAAAVVFASPGVGQSVGNAPLLLELPANTRALALGGAFVLSTAESDAIFYNAGSLVNAEGVHLAFSQKGGALAVAQHVSQGELAVDHRDPHVPPVVDNLEALGQGRAEQPLGE